jgi:hypothetical protein
MIRRALSLLILTGLALLIAGIWPDIVRYAKIELLSRGSPAQVPADGRKAYPQRPADGAADGTGDFDSARRGGPALGPR